MALASRAVELELHRGESRRRRRAEWRRCARGAAAGRRRSWHGGDRGSNRGANSPRRAPAFSSSAAAELAWCSRWQLHQLGRGALDGAHVLEAARWHHASAVAGPHDSNADRVCMSIGALTGVADRARPGAVSSGRYRGALDGDRRPLGSLESRTATLRICGVINIASCPDSR